MYKVRHPSGNSPWDILSELQSGYGLSSCDVIPAVRVCAASRRLVDLITSDSPEAGHAVLWDFYRSIFHGHWVSDGLEGEVNRNLSQLLNPADLASFVKPIMVTLAAWTFRMTQDAYEFIPLLPLLMDFAFQNIALDTPGLASELSVWAILVLSNIISESHGACDWFLENDGFSAMTDLAETSAADGQKVDCIVRLMTSVISHKPEVSPLAGRAFMERVRPHFGEGLRGCTEADFFFLRDFALWNRWEFLCVFEMMTPLQLLEHPNGLNDDQLFGLFGLLEALFEMYRSPDHGCEMWTDIEIARQYSLSGLPFRAILGAFSGVRPPRCQIRFTEFVAWAAAREPLLVETAFADYDLLASLDFWLKEGAHSVRIATIRCLCFLLTRLKSGIAIENVIKSEILRSAAAVLCDIDDISLVLETLKALVAFMEAAEVGRETAAGIMDGMHDQSVFDEIAALEENRDEPLTAEVGYLIKMVLDKRDELCQRLEKFEEEDRIAQMRKEEEEAAVPPPEPGPESGLAYDDDLLSILDYPADYGVDGVCSMAGAFGEYGGFGYTDEWGERDDLTRSSGWYW
jgi:hypothetical protein